jgi:hypothetical protein
MPLFLYGDLSFEEEDGLEAHLDECGACRQVLAREKVLHRALDEAEVEVEPQFLLACRQELRSRVAGAGMGRPNTWGRLREFFTIRIAHLPPGVQPIGAVALLLMGFFGGRMFQPSATELLTTSGFANPVSRVRYVEPEPSGKVQIVLEETRQKTLTGSLEDEAIQRWLVTATKDPADPGLRVESVDLLKGRAESTEVRNALLYALQHDANPGVRLKALDGLKSSAEDPEVRQTLSRVLLADKNPGVRTQVIDLLIQHKEDQVVGVLQELMRKEENGYVRMRCQKALHEMNASVESF